MRRLTFVAVAGALLLAAAQPLEAQRKQLRLTPFAGGSIISGTVDFENTFVVGASLMYRIGFIFRMTTFWFALAIGFAGGVICVLQITRQRRPAGERSPASGWFGMLRTIGRGTG